jgi:hypothetical protein
MNTPAGKTARFKEVVERCGSPELYTAWMDPKRDPRFQEAWQENRILSVKQKVGGKKDVGEVGYLKEPGVAYLIFPKSLEAFAGRKIVGIQYDLLASPRPVGRAVGRGQRPKRAEPEPKRYEVTVRVMAVVHVSEVVEAASMHEAEQAAMKNVQARDVNFSEAKVIRRIMKAKKV